MKYFHILKKNSLANALSTLQFRLYCPFNRYAVNPSPLLLPVSSDQTQQINTQLDDQPLCFHDSSASAIDYSSLAADFACCCVVVQLSKTSNRVQRDSPVNNVFTVSTAVWSNLFKLMHSLVKGRSAWAGLLTGFWVVSLRRAEALSQTPTNSFTKSLKSTRSSCWSLQVSGQNLAFSRRKMETDKFNYVYSCDLDINVQLKM